MIVRIAPRGRSFSGASKYYLFDRNSAETSERVEWVHTENIGSQDGRTAFRWMAYSAMAANEEKKRTRTPGRRIEKSVWTIALSWSPDETPTREHMVETGKSWLTSRGLADHQTVMVAHNDERYAHLHLIVNLVNPSTNKVNKKAVSHAKLSSSKWAEKYEKANGTILCKKRVENNERREKGEFVKHEEEADFKARVTNLYKAADNGKAFIAALKEHGYSVAQGRRLLVVDRNGKPHSLFRQIEGVDSADIKERLKGIDLPTLKERSEEDAGTRSQRRQQRREKPAEYFDRDKQQRQSDERVIDAGIAHERRQTRQREQDDTRGLKRSELLNALQDRHTGQRGALSDKAFAARASLSQTIDAQYGAHERQLRREVIELEKNLGAGLIFGRAKKVQRLEEVRLTLSNIEQRKGEAVGALEVAIKQERNSLEQSISEERQQIEDRFAPLSLDPSAQQHRAQQAQQSTAMLGAAAPSADAGAGVAGVPPLSPTFDAAAGKEARRTADIERQSAAREQAGEQPGPAPSEE